MRNLFLLFCTVFIMACGDDSTSPAPTPSLTGSYTMTLDLAGTLTDNGATVAARCAGTVPTKLTDTKGTITGTMGAGAVVCTIDGWDYDVDWSSAVTGTRSGTSVTLDDGLCEYKGDMDNGTARCVANDGTTALSLTGTWTLTP